MTIAAIYGDNWKLRCMLCGHSFTMKRRRGRPPSLCSQPCRTIHRRISRRTQRRNKNPRLHYRTLTLQIERDHYNHIIATSNRSQELLARHQHLQQLLNQHATQPHPAPLHVRSITDRAHETACDLADVSRIAAHSLAHARLTDANAPT